MPHHVSQGCRKIQKLHFLNYSIFLSFKILENSADHNDPNNPFHFDGFSHAH